MRSAILSLVVLAAVAAVPAGAQEVSNTQAFPAAAHIAGVPPSQWVSDVVVNNVNDYEIVVGFQFFPENQAHTFFDLRFDHQITMAARETRLFEDVLATLLGYTEDIKGALFVTCEPEFLPSSGNPEDSKIIATMRTYDVSSPEGTYGQTIPSTEWVDNFTENPSYLTGARNDDRFRSNLGIVNLSLVETTIHYRIMRSDATVVVQGSKTMGSLSTGQWSFERLGVGTVEGPLTVDLWFDPSSVSTDPCDDDFPNSFLAYVSKVDGESQDGEFIYAAPGEFPPCW